jgi:hypothetical protein
MTPSFSGMLVHPVVPIVLAVFVHARVEEASPALGFSLAVVVPLLVALRIAVIVLGNEDTLLRRGRGLG